MLKRIMVAIGLAACAFAQNPNTAAFPGAVAGDNTLLVANNNAQTTLSVALSNSSTSIVVASAGAFRAPTAITIEQEQIFCLTLTSNTFSNCSRGAQGTTALPHNLGIPVYGNIVAYYQNQNSAEIKAIEAALGPNFQSGLVPNDGSTGTTLGRLAKVNASGNAINALTSDTTVPVYCVVGGAGTSGSVNLATSGQASCKTDASGATAGDWLVASGSVAGTIHDAGVSIPSSGWIIGIAQTTASSGANVTFTVLSFTGTGGGGGGTASNYIQSFSTATTVTLNHGLGTKNLTLACFDSLGNGVEQSSWSVNQTNPFAATVNFLVAQTGYCVLGGGSAPHYAATFTSQTTVTVTGTTHALGTSNIAIQCKDSSSPARILQPDTVTIDPSTFTVVITFATSQSGACVLL